MEASATDPAGPRAGRWRHVAFVMTGAGSLAGGIAAVNLNLLHALVELTRQVRFRLSVSSLLERDSDRPDFLPDHVAFRGFAGSKLALSADLMRQLPRRPLYFYERVGLAIPTLPLAALRLAATVLFAHGSENWRGVRRVDLASIRTARLVITNSRYTLRRMQQYVTGFRGVACPLGLSPVFPLNDRPPAAARETIELEAADGRRRRLGERVLLLVARMDPLEREKGHPQLLAALPSLLQRFPGTQLVCPGPGSDRFLLQRRASELGVASAVFFPGHVSSALLETLYRHCYAFVMPSKQEGFGLAYLEAMNQARPCLGCFEDGAEDVIVPGETGLLIRDPDDPLELLGALSTLLADPQQAADYGRRGFERLHRHFTADQFRSRFKQVFGTLLAGQPPGRHELPRAADDREGVSAGAGR